MKRLWGRVADLEARQTVPLGKGHMLIQREGQTQDEVIDAYGRHLIGKTDRVIINRIVSPRFNSDGSMLLYSDWPENVTGARVQR
jgi:hypothetical protein